MEQPPEVDMAPWLSGAEAVKVHHVERAGLAASWMPVKAGLSFGAFTKIHSIICYFALV